MKDVQNSGVILYNKEGKIRVKSHLLDREIDIFLISTTVIFLLCLFSLDIEWQKLITRLPMILTTSFDFILFDFTHLDPIVEGMIETIFVAVLATIYSIGLGLVFGLLSAKNIVKNNFIVNTISSLMTFIRAVPTPVWVLFMLICLGFGPQAGIIGLSFHAIAFFGRAFSQCFEDIPKETIEALEVTGANIYQIIFSAIIPAASSQLIAWSGLRLEINFAESAILGMIGGGGIGLVIYNFLMGYNLKSAGVALLFIFIFAYLIELGFVLFKKRFLN